MPEPLELKLIPCPECSHECIVVAHDEHDGLWFACPRCDQAGKLRFRGGRQICINDISVGQALYSTGPYKKGE